MKPYDNQPPELRVAPKPFEYNPSSWSQRTRVSLVAAVATVIAAYMGLFQMKLIDTVWDPFFDSAAVLTSDVSHTMSRWFRIHDSMFGALAYLGDIVFAMAGSTRRWQYRPWLVVVFGIDVIPLGIVSAILVFMQAFVVGNWCTLCLVTAVLSLILVVLAYDEVWSCLLYLWQVWRDTKSWRILGNTFIGRPSDEAHAAAEKMITRRLEKGVTG